MTTPLRTVTVCTTRGLVASRRAPVAATRQVAPNRQPVRWRWWCDRRRRRSRGDLDEHRHHRARPVGRGLAGTTVSRTRRSGSRRVDDHETSPAPEHRDGSPTRASFRGSHDAVQRPIPVWRSIQLFNRTARRCRCNRSRPSPSDSSRRASARTLRANSSAVDASASSTSRAASPASRSRTVGSDLSQRAGEDIDMIPRHSPSIQRRPEPGHLGDGLSTIQQLLGLAERRRGRRQPTPSPGTTTPSPTLERRRPRGFRPTTSTGATHQPQPRA